MSKDRRRQRFKWFLLANLALLLPMLIGLGCWQLDRAAQKQRLMERWQNDDQARPLSAASRQLDRVEIVGQLDTEHWFLLDNRTRQGRVGYEVIAKVQPEQGDAGLLVNLGWLAADPDRRRLPTLELPVQRIRIEGRLHMPGAGLLLAEDVWQTGWPKRIQQLQPDRLAVPMAQPLLPWVLQLEQPLVAGLQPNWTPVVLMPERHLGYAIQWFGLSLALLVLTAVAWRHQRERGG
ncbi:SURF1 family protein [Marinobacterium arenosum]|uniref:SURF1 family protein n=1 Tax=Marinobacterium arenosum TaxID=2862496 RepID=UPI001C9480C9|nr:SURF1 family protein [Marinobacterium arenosum]MBY4675497.1 SURF1 family protein [Marinobacterium arenosum]